MRMEDCRIPNQALNWNLSSINGKPGKNLKDTGLSWDEARELSHSRNSWRQRVILRNTGRTQNSGQKTRKQAMWSIIKLAFWTA